MIKNKKFQRWDFGKTKNMQKYGSATPPDYDLSKIAVKMAMATGDVDMLADKEDVKWLMDSKQSGINSDLLIWNKEYHFDHGSFTQGNDASYFDNDIIPIIEK